MELTDCAGFAPDETRHLTGGIGGNRMWPPKGLRLGGGHAMSLLSKFSRRGFLKYGSLSGLAAFVTSCLSQNAPAVSPTPGASGGASAAPTVATGATITWKIQSGWAGNDIFQTMFLNWKASVEEMSGCRIKIDELRVKTININNGMIDAVNSGTRYG